MAGLDGISTLAQVLGSLAPNGNSSSSIKAATPVTETSALSQVKSGTSSQESGLTTDTTSFGLTGGVIAAALTTPDVRLDKVAALQSSIANGSYSVSSADVAGKIVDSLLK